MRTKRARRCVLLILLVALAVFTKCYVVFRNSNEYHDQDEVVLDIWFAMHNKKPQPFIADTAVAQQGLEAILKRRMNAESKYTLRLRFSKDIDSHFALSLVERCFAHGYTNIVIQLQQDLSHELGEARLGESDAPCYAF